MLDVIEEPLITATTATGGRQGMSLPRLYSEMMEDSVLSFPNLRPHQEHGWHSFMAQLGALAIRKAERGGIPEDEQEWRELLLNLTPGQREAWDLLTDDLTKPAFLQPPVSDPEMYGGYRNTHRTPDNADCLATSKNFEAKREMTWEAEPSDWIFALVSLQTLAHNIGRGHYNTSRMNGGSGSRSAIFLKGPGGPGAHLRRDILVILERTPDTGPEAPALLWTLPWDGEKEETIPTRRLNPLYIDAARRVRLETGPDGRIQAKRTGTKMTRSGEKGNGGITGDPWAPVELGKDGKSKILTIERTGFSQSRLLAIALDRERWEPPAALTPTEEETHDGRELVISARGTAGGQGETNGFHHTEFPAGAALTQAMLDQDLGLEAREILQDREKQVLEVQNCLIEALAYFIAGGDREKIRNNMREMAKDRLKPFPKARPQNLRLAAALDRTAARDLQKELEAPKEKRPAVRARWLTGPGGVIPVARAMLEAMTPSHGGQQQTAAESARSMFEGMLNNPKRLPAWVPQDWEPEKPREEEIRRKERQPGDERHAPALASAIAQLAYRKPQTLGELQRMDQGNPDLELFRELTGHLWENREPERRIAWGIIVRGIAMMTQVRLENHRISTAHRKGRTLGRALHLGNERRPTYGFMSQQRVQELLAVRGQAFRYRMSSTFARLGRAGAKLDWEDAARFVLEHETPETRGETYQEYLRTKFRPSSNREPAAEDTPEC
jgi:CRISPR system Cascade subunit CasA